MTTVYLQSFGLLILQLFCIFVVAQVLGRLVAFIKQPPVIGEVLAGILLGPSLLGWLFPDFFNFLFPLQSIAPLKIVSETGLLLFMFTIGTHSSPAEFKKNGKNVVLISQAGIVVPFIFGILLSFYLVPLKPEGVSFFYFSLFCGISLSVTAFPVLARIIEDRKLSHMTTARMALNAAALQDVMAWMLLAFLVSLVKGSSLIGLFMAVFGSFLGIMVLLFWVAPYLEHNLSKLKRSQIPCVIILLVVSSLFFQWVGVHALFGAFMAGVIMPRSFIQNTSLLGFQKKINFVLLPAFFAVTGLNTSIGLLNEASLWGWCALIIVVAILGKMGGVSIAARFSGFSWRQSFFLGVLMNTRGLMELVVLNMGLELKVISPALFSMMVLMALFTTAMAGPLIDLSRPKQD